MVQGSRLIWILADGGHLRASSLRSAESHRRTGEHYTT